MSERTVCEHGSLARVCLVCELTAELAEMTERAERAEAALRELDEAAMVQAIDRAYTDKEALRSALAEAQRALLDMLDTDGSSDATWEAVTLARSALRTTGEGG